MTTAVTSHPARPSHRAIPLPVEHGAWIILYAPLLIAAFLVTPLRPTPSLLLLLAVSAAFLARHELGLVARGRLPAEHQRWLALYLLLFTASALALLLVYRPSALLIIGVLAGALMMVHTLLLVAPGKRRLDRSVWGELLATAALCLSAPALFAASTGRIPARAWLLWAACALFFSSGIFNVKMLLASVKTRNDPERRWSAGRDSLVYHLALVVLVSAAAAWLPAREGALIALAYAPAVIRAAYWWARMPDKLPRLKRVGLLETGYSIWFAGMLILALKPL